MPPPEQPDLASVQLAGLQDIEQAAARFGVDVTDAVHKARMMMLSDPPSVRSGGDRLTTIADGLGQQNIGQAGAEVLGSGLTGQTADAFGPYQADLTNQLAGVGELTRQLAAEFGTMATAFQASQDTVVAATGATAAALRMLQV